MTAQCIPSRINTLTAWGVVGASAWALWYTSTPETTTILTYGLLSAGAAAAGLVTYRLAGRLRRRPRQPAPHPPANDWLAEIRRRPAKLRGEGAAELVSLPLVLAHEKVEK